MLIDWFLRLLMGEPDCAICGEYDPRVFIGSRDWHADACPRRTYPKVERPS